MSPIIPYSSLLVIKALFSFFNIAIAVLSSNFVAPNCLNLNSPKTFLNRSKLKFDSQLVQIMPTAKNVVSVFMWVKEAAKTVIGGGRGMERGGGSKG